MNAVRKMDSAWLRFRARRFIELCHVLAIVVVGISLFPAVAFLYFLWQALAPWAPWLKLLVFSLCMGPAYFLFGMMLILTSVVLRFVLGLGIRPGLYGFQDWEAIRWMGYNTFILVVNKCFLDNFRLSPFQTFFYRAMGARIGRDVKINTHGFADLSLIEIGDRAVIGDGVTLICHAADRGFLRLAPVRVGKDVSIGLDTIIMPDVELGEGAVISPRSVLISGTRVPPRGRWGGTPARDIRHFRRFPREPRREGRREEGREQNPS